jgi:hypothetical protein
MKRVAIFTFICLSVALNVISQMSLQPSVFQSPEATLSYRF